MTADPYMERVQRRVLDDAGHRDVPVKESVAQGGPLPARPMFAEKDGCEWISHSFTLDRDTDVFFGPSPILPSVEQYADADRLLRDRGPLDADAARLRCWIADTKPLAVKAGWNDDAPLIEYPTPLDWQDIIDRVRAELPSPRPSLWQRTPEWAIWLGTAVLIVALLALPVIA